MNKAADIIEKYSEEIIDVWKKRCTIKIEASGNVSKIALIDHVPHMLEDIAEIFRRYAPNPDASQEDLFQEIVQNSTSHGRLRAITEQYSVAEVIREYIIIHRTITETLKKYGVYKVYVADVLKYIIETAILRSTEAFANSVQEMQEKLVGTLAHDIRNPLTVAQASMQLIDGEHSEKNLEKLKTISLRSIKKAVDLTEGLLDAISARAGQGITLNFEKGDYAMSIKSVHIEIEDVYEYDFKVEVPEVSVTGIYDLVAVRRIIENLITNAIKYGDVGRPITTSLLVEDNYAIIEVHNYGNPIPASDQQSIFGFLSSSDQDNVGSTRSWGMGLSLVKMIAEAHGGRIELQSTEETGTKFSVYLDKDANKVGKIRSMPVE
ncbi:MAG: sensor histidine kinase [Cyclobacteriaceae bacterium]